MMKTGTLGIQFEHCGLELIWASKDLVAHVAVPRGSERRAFPQLPSRVVLMLLLHNTRESPHKKKIPCLHSPTVLILSNFFNACSSKLKKPCTILNLIVVGIAIPESLLEKRILQLNNCLEYCTADGTYMRNKRKNCIM